MWMFGTTTEKRHCYCLRTRGWHDDIPKARRSETVQALLSLGQTLLREIKGPLTS